MKRLFTFLVFLGLATSPLQSATLERLSMADMIGKSTAIVRARVTGISTARTGPVIYTHYRLQVSERYKGPGQSTVDLALPGGVSGGVQQFFSGVPQLHTGGEYIFFLWTGKSGLTQVIGLSQGLFAITDSAAKDPSVHREATHETMLDRVTGRPVQDQPITLRLSALKSEIASALDPKESR